MNAKFSDRHCQLIAYLIMIILALLLVSQRPASGAESDRKVVEWTFSTSETPADVTQKLRAIESEIVAKYDWQVAWQRADVSIHGKFFDACVQCTNGCLCVRMELEPTLYAFKGTIRRAFENELRKHLALL